MSFLFGTIYFDFTSLNATLEECPIRFEKCPIQRENDIDVNKCLRTKDSLNQSLCWTRHSFYILSLYAYLAYTMTRGG